MDLVVGDRQHLLTVLNKSDQKNSRGQTLWECSCDCGNLTTITPTMFRRGMKKSCGCLKVTHGNRVHIGQTYNHYTVIDRIMQNGKPKWLVRCVCGKQNVLGTGDIGRKKSCGCQRPKDRSYIIRDLIGQTFGHLKALSMLAERRNGFRVWLCSCSCGETTKVTSVNLTGGAVKSCGHLLAGGRRLPDDGRSRKVGYRAARLQAYRARKALRTPCWSDPESILEFYLNCPQGYQVDHVVPLHGDKISGLHVRHNLQYLPRSVNASKTNRFDPRVEVKGETPRWFDEMNLPS